MSAQGLETVRGDVEEITLMLVRRSHVKSPEGEGGRWGGGDVDGVHSIQAMWGSIVLASSVCKSYHTSTASQECRVYFTHSWVQIAPKNVARQNCVYPHTSPRR